AGAGGPWRDGGWRGGRGWLGPRPASPDPSVAFAPDLLGQVLNGLAYGALLFLLSVGLTLIFGMLDVINLAHGSFYMLGAYAGLTLIAATGSFWLALAVAPLAVGLVGLVVDPGLLPPPSRPPPL